MNFALEFGQWFENNFAFVGYSKIHTVEDFFFHINGLFCHLHRMVAVLC